MNKMIPTIIGIVGGAVGLALGVVNMTGLMASSNEQLTLLAVGQFAMGIGLVTVASAQNKPAKKQ